MKPPRFTNKDVELASQQWEFNCGPAALCAMLDLTPDELRPHMHHPKRGDRKRTVRFEDVGYTSPTMLFATLKNLLVPHRTTYRSDNPTGECNLQYGLLRVQFGGPWCKPGVPPAARYHATHWVGVSENDMIFDVNATITPQNGWISYNLWRHSLMPWLSNSIPKCDMTWWPTHAIELDLPKASEK